MEKKMDDHLCIHIGERLRAHSARSSDSCIFRVPRHLRDVNEKAYEPLVVAIGPYHRGKDHLKKMEELKLHYVKMLLQRTGEGNLQSYIQAMRSIELTARTFYAEDLNHLQPDEFVEMMLFDSCFIFEVIREFIGRAMKKSEDPLFEASCTDNAVLRDLLLVENQLPLFVLLDFFEMTKIPNEIFNNFILMISVIFDCMLPKGNRINWEAPGSNESIRNSGHLLGLLHSVWLPKSPKNEEKYQWKFIPSATRLKEAGINFKKAKAAGSLFDIKFENGFLEIPTLIVSDRTESFFRNLIAYEEFFRRESLYVADYVRFIDCLINSEKDVELLCERGIIDNWLGDEKVVARMFNKLRDNITCGGNFYYHKLFNKVNEHCERRCNEWMANLRHKYFNTPWALLSLLAAILLLLLTLAQTVFSVIAYIKK